MPDVFLSYSREDKAIASRFAEGLRREGFDVWWDQTLHSGDPYDRLTEQALRDSKAAVVLWSRNSVDSRWVRAEATMADRRGILVPVMVGDCERPLMFELTQAAELAHWKGDQSDPAWCAFIADVRRFVSGEAGAAKEDAKAREAGNHTSHKSRPQALRYGLVAALLLLVGAVGWRLWNRDAGSVDGQAGATVVAQPEAVSIAVLPFVDMTAQGIDAPLAEGIAEEISNWLAQIPDLHVVARTSSFMFKGANQDVRKVGKQLDATHLLEGSVRRGDGMVRITVQLVATSDGYHLWSRTFNMPDTDALHIEDAVSRAVAEALNARLSDETERRWKARQARVPEAYDLYLQGRAEQKKRTTESNLRAMDLYRQAIEQDRSFPLPYVSLAETTLNGVTLARGDYAAVAAQVTALLDQADAVTPDLPETIAVRGWLATELYRMEDARVLLERAVALNPNNADAQRRLGNLYARMSQPRKAADQYAIAAQLDPMDFNIQVNRCLSLQDLGEHVAAEEACGRARQLNASHFWGPLATSYLEMGRGEFASALGWLDGAVEKVPGDYWLMDYRVWMLLAMYLDDEALRTVARLPESASPRREFLAASIAVARQDRAATGPALEAFESKRGLFGMTDWLNLAGLQLVSGDAASAKATLDLARQSPSWQPATLAEPDHVRMGYSASIAVAGIELAAGNRSAAIEILDALDSMLDKVELGGAACGGLYALRAHSRAMRGDPEGAMTFLRRAQEKGWREARAARVEPYLQALRDRPDFRQLLETTDREIRAEATAIPGSLD
jgi:TolB-like protein